MKQIVSEYLVKDIQKEIRRNTYNYLKHFNVEENEISKM